ncbi:ALF repeat-containing protein [Streptomyces sp. NPDC002308]
MKSHRVALLITATALAPALLFTAPAFAAGSTAAAPVAVAASTTPVATTSATACPALSSGTGTPTGEMSEDELRATIQGILADANAGKGVRREADEALAGTVDDMRTFLETGCRLAQAEDDTVTVFRILNAAQQNGDKRVTREVNTLLDAGTPESLRTFLETGYAQAQAEDDAVAVARILYLAGQNGDKRVAREAGEALDAYTPEALSHFRWTEYRLAQAEDDSVYIVRMLTDPNISDAMYDAIAAVLDDGSPEALRQFRTVGQYEIDG